MSFINSIQNRYTTKMYDPSGKIDKAQIDELKEILRMIPSSINSQPWRFTFVSDTETKNKLAGASFFNEEKVRNCDTLVVFSRVDKLRFFEKDIENRLPQPALDYYAKFIKAQPEAVVKSWFDRQVYLALGMFLSACAEMDIDSTPMEGIDASGYDAILGNENYKTLVAVAIGKRDSEDFNQPEKKPKSRKSLEEVIISI